VYGAKDSAKSIDYTKPLATFTGGTSGVVTGLAASSTYYLVCRARDASENEDDNTTVVSAATSADSIAPTFGGVTSITNVTATSVDLVWTGATDDKTAPSDIVYAIWASPTTPVDTTVKETTTVKGATSTTVSGLTPATKYYFVVRARDSAGNEDTNKIEKSATTNVSFVLSVQPIFTASCAVANCHSGTSPPANMKLEEGLAYSYIVNVNSVENPAFKRVKPGDSANSYLYQKLIGTHMCAPSWPTATAGCATMPLSATGVEPITPAQKDQIKTWIDQGASDK
jgi:hypothetical protein